MEQEYFISGYCRAIDQSRMVSAEFADNRLTEADCGYPDCPYTDRCTVAARLNQLQKEGTQSYV